MTMKIEVDGVGTYHLPNEWQYQRLGRMRGEKRQPRSWPSGAA